MKKYFWQKLEGVILHNGNLDGRKLERILVVLSQGEWFRYFVSVLRKVSYKLETIQMFLHRFLCPKEPERKIPTSFLALNVAYRTLVQFTKAWTP